MTALGAGRPLAVLMSGPPGAGKSTVAAMLGDRLHLPVLDKDRLRQGVRLTLRARDLDGVPPGPPLFYDAMSALLRLGVSSIGDMTLFRGLSEPDIEARLAPLADLANVHCYTHLSVERFRARCAQRNVPDARVEEMLPLVRDLARDLVAPLDLGCPTIVVDTTDGFVPGVEEVAAFVGRLRGAAS